MALLLAEQNYLCNLCKGHHKKQFCEIILNLDRWFSRISCLKDFFRALAALMFSGAEQFMQFLIEGIMGNIHVKLFFDWD